MTFRDNLLDQDPHFVDPWHDNFQLRDDSPAWKLGFVRIPLERIGMYPIDDPRLPSESSPRTISSVMIRPSMMVLPVPGSSASRMRKS